MSASELRAANEHEQNPSEPEEPAADPASRQRDDDLRRRLLLRRFWESAFGFWRRGGDRLAWLLSAGILLTILLNLGLSYAMNVWNRAIFDGLEQHDGQRVLYLSLIYFPLLAASVAPMLLQ